MWGPQIVGRLTALLFRPAQVCNIPYLRSCSALVCCDLSVAWLWGALKQSSPLPLFLLASMHLAGETMFVSEHACARTGEAKGKKQIGEEGASSGAASGADDELLNTKDLNFFGDASVIECAALLLLTQLQTYTNILFLPGP